MFNVSHINLLCVRISIMNKGVKCLCDTLWRAKTVIRDENSMKQNIVPLLQQAHAF